MVRSLTKSSIGAQQRQAGGYPQGEQQIAVSQVAEQQLPPTSPATMNRPPIVGVACLPWCRRRDVGRIALDRLRKSAAQPGDQPRAQQHGQHEANQSRQRRAQSDLSQGRPLCQAGRRAK